MPERWFDKRDPDNAQSSRPEDCPAPSGGEPGEGDGADWDELLAQLADQGDDDGWVTLAEASAAAGVARSTLRSWYRSGLVPARTVAGAHGPQRLLRLDAVLERAVRSARVRHQLEHMRSLEAEVEQLRSRVAALERYLGLD